MRKFLRLIKYNPEVIFYICLLIILGLVQIWLQEQLLATSVNIPFFIMIMGFSDWAFYNRKMKTKHKFCIRLLIALSLTILENATFQILNLPDCSLMFIGGIINALCMLSLIPFPQLINESEKEKNKEEESTK